VLFRAAAGEPRSLDGGEEDEDEMLDDVLARNLTVVFCGTAAGHRSAQRRAYYAGRGNRFWRTLAAVGLTPQELAPAECARLLDYGIGLTDLAKDQSGSDRDLQIDRADVLLLRSRIAMYQPKYLCFNGKRAAQVFLSQSQIDYGVQRERIGRTVLYVAPSTSGAASGAWDLAVWQDLANRVLRNHRRTAAAPDGGRVAAESIRESDGGRRR
jgi:TDG/mug DNA glycosylase family protein